MASITSSGIGSGLDVNGLVNQLLELERKPLTDLDRKEAVYQAQLSAYGGLKSALAGFQNTMQGLSSLSRFQGLKATVGDATLFSASAAATAVPGSYSIEVKQLAQAQKLASKAFTNTTDVVGSGTLTIQFGTASGGTFTANAAKPAKTVTIDAAHNSLSGVRDAINAATIGVNATILNDGSGFKLVLSSQDSGAANSLKITVSDSSDASNTDDAGLSQLAYDPAVAGTPPQPGKNLTETQAALNALLKVDGIDNIAKSSNLVSDVIQGVTLNLTKAAVGSPTTLTVSRDTATVKKGVEDFVKAYNDLNKTVRDYTAYDAATKRAALLQGDSSALSLISQVRRTLSGTVTGLNGSLTLLSQVGVSFQSDGSLALDATKLQSAMDTSFNDIAGLFAAQGRPSDSLVNYVASSDKTQPGSYAVSVSQLASQGAFNGAGTAALADTSGTFNTPFAINGNNDTLSLKIDGIATATVTLAQGNYLTATALTAELQSKINGDTALAAAGVSVAVSFDTAADRLVITSARYGSASTVEVTGVDTDTAATLGLSVAAGSAGVDVAGTIGGGAASGSGRQLSGATGSAVEGLKLEIIGGATGDRGSVNYSQGYAWQLDQLAERLLGTAGPITSRSDGLNNRIEALDTQRDRINRHLDEVEKRLRAQFGALDSLVAQLRSTSDFLTRQLGTLQSLSSSSSAQGSR